jgi:hypothetical protein
MRTSFELKFESEDYNSAFNTATKYIGDFLEIKHSEVSEKADIELKVELVDGKYQVTAYGKVKTTFVSFGLDKDK